MSRSQFIAVLTALPLLALPQALGASRVPFASTITMQVEGKGAVVIELYTTEAPKATAHVTKLAESGFYNNQKIFRVMKDPKPFLVLFGDPQTKTKPINDASIGQGGSGARIPYENSGKSNVRGAVGLSTKPRDKDSGDSQFYILLDTKPFLDGSYTVFGQVVRGMDVVEKLDVGDQVTSVSVSRG